MKRKDQDPDLFAWADTRPIDRRMVASAEIVDFLEVRPTLPRWILARRSDLEVALLRLDRRLGLAPIAPIFPFRREA